MAEPLAILEGPYRDRRKIRHIVNSWAKEHPEADGYIIVTDDPQGIGIYTGGAFYRVADGLATGVLAIDCQPDLFQMDRQRAIAARDHRKQTLVHPRCPHCICLRRAFRD